MDSGSNMRDAVLNALREMEAVFALSVDQVIREEVPAGTEVAKPVTDYAKNVEQAASDLATPTERERILKGIMGPIFSTA